MKDKSLYLTLKKKPFDVMVTGEKKEEYRENSQWIKSSHFDKKGKVKTYTNVIFVNGYGENRPMFIAEFKGVRQVLFPKKITYSNGLEVKQNLGDYIISLGKIILIKNHESQL